MPTYDYVCGSCNERFEIFHGMHADPLQECPKCGDSRLKRLIGGGAGIIFRGSGFYANDSRAARKTDTPATTTAAPAGDAKVKQASAVSTSGSSDGAAKAAE